jgi:hypothetical protein
MSDISVGIAGPVSTVRLLRDFFITTLAGGTEPFTHPNDPVTGKTETYRFMAPPVFTPLSHEEWQIQLTLRRL